MTEKDTVTRQTTTPGTSLGAAAARLEAALAARARDGDVDPPDVVPVGGTDATRPDRDPHAPRRPAARVHVAADQVLVGPFGAGAATGSPCGHCLALRWQALRPRSVRDGLETGSGAGERPSPRPSEGAQQPWPEVTDFLADATWQLLRGLAARRPGPPGRGALVGVVDLASGGVRTASLLPDPACPACHPPAPDPRPARVALVPRARPAGRTRLRAASAYPLDEDALVNPVCGVLGPGTVADLASPTTTAVSGQFLERGRAGLHDLGWSGKAGTFGASRRLGMLEGLERYAGSRARNGGPVVVDSLAGLGAAALDPRACGEYPAATYGRDPVLRPFSPDQPVPWVRGYSLRDHRELLVPLRTAYYGWSSPVDDFVFECSNGCATGSCVEEAVLFGLLELVERDAFLLGWYGGARLTGIDPRSVPSADVRGLVDRAELHGYDVRLLDNRVDLSIPVVTALVSRRDGGDGLLSFAAGAALDPAQAADAALDEALTYLPHMAHEVASRRAEVEAMAEDYDRVTELRHHALLFGLPRMAGHARRYLRPERTLSFGEVYDQVPAQSTDLLADLRRCVAEVVAAGCDVVVVDQTSPEQSAAGLSTVRVLAPGLVPIDFGWGRQRALQSPRLRTACVRAGWRATPLTDEDLHRVPHPFP